MSYSMHLLSGSATAGSVEVSKNCFEGLFKSAEWRSLIEASIMDLARVVQTFLGKPGSPSSVYAFERELEKAGREFLRGLVQWVFNRLEGDDTSVLPKHVVFESASYTLIKKKNRQDVWTRYGKISIWRFGYRSTIKGHDLSIFPLAKVLGLIHGATPGLAEEVARLLGEGGHDAKPNHGSSCQGFWDSFRSEKAKAVSGGGLRGDGGGTPPSPGGPVGAIADTGRSIKRRPQTRNRSGPGRRNPWNADQAWLVV